MASHYPIPSTPRVISPSPTPSETGSSKDGYFGPVTRSISRASRVTSPPPIPEDAGADSSGSDPDKRARTRSRSPILEGKRRRMSGLTAVNPKSGMPSAATGRATKRKKEQETATNGHLSLPNRSYWRELSRSPSPLGLIPIHTKWRSFIHRHEIPRKFLHISIGFLTLTLYTRGVQTSAIHPVLLTLLIPIATTDILRHRFDSLNRLYIRCLGALMRESEVDGYNGVIWYLFGTWAVLRFCPKDIGVMSVLLLSWCDTAASTFGRLWGRYTPPIRKGKSLAGSLAAMAFGIGTAVLFWGFCAGRWCKGCDEGEHAFAFQGALTLPAQVRNLLGWTESQSTITGKLAIGVISVWAGFVAAASEAVDLWGWDDNFTIPVLCGAGLWGFLRIFEA